VAITSRSPRSLNQVDATLPQSIVDVLSLLAVTFRISPSPFLKIMDAPGAIPKKSPAVCKPETFTNTFPLLLDRLHTANEVQPPEATSAPSTPASKSVAGAIVKAMPFDAVAMFILDRDRRSLFFRRFHQMPVHEM
jgi:hypothetical protein